MEVQKNKYHPNADGCDKPVHKHTAGGRLYYRVQCIKSSISVTSLLENFHHAYTLSEIQKERDDSSTKGKNAQGILPFDTQINTT